MSIKIVKPKGKIKKPVRTMKFMGTIDMAILGKKTKVRKASQPVKEKSSK